MAGERSTCDDAGSTAGRAAPAALPLVSVLIPAYNRADTIGATLDSLVQQTYPNTEIVVVDDGSRDGTAAVVARYGDRVRYVYQSNRGLAAARNRAQQESRGRLLAWLDADDVCEPERLAVQVACLEEMSDVGLCCSDFSAFTEAGPLASSYIADYYRVVREAPGGLPGLFGACRTLAANPAVRGLLPAGTVTVYQGALFDRLVWGNFVHPPTIMFRRELLEQVGDLDESYSNLCDYDWLLRASRSASIAFIDRPLLRYRLSPGQMSGDHNTVTIKLETIRIIEKIAALDPDYYTQQRTALRVRAGKAYLGAADLEAETDKVASLGHLLRGVRLAGVRSLRASTLVKLALPASVIRRLRESRAQAAGAR